MTISKKEFEDFKKQNSAEHAKVVGRVGDLEKKVVEIDTKLDGHIEQAKERHDDLKDVMTERTKEITNSINRLDNRFWIYCVGGGGAIALVVGLIIAYIEYVK